MRRIAKVCVFAFVSFLASDIEASDDELLDFFGSLRPEAIAVSREDGDLARRMDDGYSRIGVRGQTDLGTWTGFYRYERRVSANDGESDGAARADRNELRQVHVGVRGKQGSLSIGRHYGIYYDYIDDELDRHRSHYSDAIVFGDLFVSNAVVYRSPDLPYGNFGILVELNDADGNGDAVEERVELAGTARFAGTSLHLGHVLSPDHDGLFGAAVSRPVGAFSVTAVFQQVDRGAADERLLSLALDAKISQTRTARVAVTQRSDSPDADRDDLYLIAGADQRLSQNLLTFLEVSVRSADGAGADESALVAGFRFDF